MPGDPHAVRSVVSALPAAAPGSRSDSAGIVRADAAVSACSSASIIPTLPGPPDRQHPECRRAYRRDLEDFARWLGAADAHHAAEWFSASPTPGPVNQLVHDYTAPDSQSRQEVQRWPARIVVPPAAAG